MIIILRTKEKVFSVEEEDEKKKKKITPYIIGGGVGSIAGVGAGHLISSENRNNIWAEKNNVKNLKKEKEKTKNEFEDWKTDNLGRRNKDHQDLIDQLNEKIDSKTENWKKLATPPSSFKDSLGNVISLDDKIAELKKYYQEKMEGKGMHAQSILFEELNEKIKEAKKEFYERAETTLPNEAYTIKGSDGKVITLESRLNQLKEDFKEKDKKIEEDYYRRVGDKTRWWENKKSEIEKEIQEREKNLLGNKKIRNLKYGLGAAAGLGIGLGATALYRSRKNKGEN